jgi:hypothetical protein
VLATEFPALANTNPSNTHTHHVLQVLRYLYRPCHRLRCCRCCPPMLHWASSPCLLMTSLRVLTITLVVSNAATLSGPAATPALKSLPVSSELFSNLLTLSSALTVSPLLSLVFSPAAPSGIFHHSLSNTSDQFRH